MAASKSIILFNGIAGFAATSLASLGVFEVGYKLRTSSSLSSGQNDPVYVEDEPQKQTERINDLGIPDGCSETCDLTAEQLRNLKFEQRSDSSIAYEGLTDGDTFELTIEDSKDPTNYPRGKKYTLKPKTTTGTVAIRNLKGDDIVLGGDGGVEIRETSGGGKLEKVPEEINNLGIPTRCETKPTEESTEQTCELTKAQLQRLKFEPKDDQTSISIKGQNEGNIVTLKIEDKKNDQTNYPNGKKYTLTSKTGKVTIKGTKDEDIVLEGDKGVDFRETSEGNKLETVENSLGIPRRCETSTEKCELTKDELQRLKFEAGDESSIEVGGLDDGNKVELKIETITDPINYPKGKKYILKSTKSEQVTIQNVKGGNITLGKENGVEIRETVKGGKLEKVLEEVNELGIPRRCDADQTEDPTIQTCDLTKEQLERLRFKTKGNKEITVEGLNGNNTVTLNVEVKKDDSINYPKGKKYILKVTTDDKVTIKGLTGGDIEIGKEKEEGVVIRETSKGGKLEKAPEEVDKLGIPTRCGTEKPCELTKEQLQRLKFETKTSSPITVTGLEKGNKVTLKVEDSSDTTNYPHKKKYTLTSTTGRVTIKGVKEGDIVLENGSDVVIREKQEGNQLEKAPEEVDALGIPTNCAVGSSCQLTKEQLRKIKFESKDGDSSVFVSGLGVNEKVELTVGNPNDSDNYPKGKKYSFKAKNEGVIIKNTKDGDIELEKDKTFDFREKEEGGGGKLETVEDSLGIPKSCKAGEVKKGSEPKTCQLTADQLKSLKIKDFGGKADSVTGLNGANKIKLTILWEEEERYSGNIRYSFDNTNNNGEIKITKGGRNTKIVEKKESWFKKEKGKLVLVESKTKSEVKMKEVNEILEKLGLPEKHKLLDTDFSDSNLPNHNKKTEDLTRVDDLKKIKFKVLGGNADSTVPSNLSSSQKIKVYFDWDGDSNKFPKNMKITFENESIDPSFEFKKGQNSVKIYKKDTNNVNNIFKVENQNDKWYLVKTN